MILPGPWWGMDDLGQSRTPAAKKEGSQTRKHIMRWLKKRN